MIGHSIFTCSPTPASPCSDFNDDRHRLHCCLNCINWVGLKLCDVKFYDVHLHLTHTACPGSNFNNVGVHPLRPNCFIHGKEKKFVKQWVRPEMVLAKVIVQISMLLWDVGFLLTFDPLLYPSPASISSMLEPIESGYKCVRTKTNSLT